jgi:hypothetical protein
MAKDDSNMIIIIGFIILIVIAFVLLIPKSNTQPSITTSPASQTVNIQKNAGATFDSSQLVQPLPLAPKSISYSNIILDISIKPTINPSYKGSIDQNSINLLNADNNLIIYYKFDANNTNFKTVNNIASNNNSYNGQMINNLNNTFTNSSGSLYTNYSNYLKCATGFLPATDYTILFWFCIDQLNISNGINKLFSIITNAGEIYIYYSNNALYINSQLGSTLITLSTDIRPLIINLNTWYHLTIIFSSPSTTYFFLNSIPINIINSNVMNGNNCTSFTLGNDGKNQNNYAVSYFSDFRIYGRALSNSSSTLNITSTISNNEVGVIYNSINNLPKIFNLNYANDSMLISHYNFISSDINGTNVMNKQKISTMAVISDSSLVQPTNTYPYLFSVLSTPPYNIGCLYLNSISAFMILETIKIIPNFSIAFWINFNLNGNILTLSDNSVNYINISMNYGTNYITIKLSFNNVIKTIPIPYNLSSNFWYHIGMVFNSQTNNIGQPLNSFYVFINGVNFYNDTTTIITNNGFTTTTNTLGNSTLGNSFIGYITDFRLYNRSLSNSEMNQLYKYNDNTINGIIQYSVPPFTNTLTSYPSMSPFEQLNNDSALVIYYTFNSINKMCVMNLATKIYDGLIINSNNISNTFYISNNASLYANSNSYLKNFVPIQLPPKTGGKIELSVTLWFCINNINNNLNKLISFIFTINNINYEMYISYSNGQLYLVTTNNNTSLLISGNQKIVMNQWHFISINSDNTSTTIWLNSSTQSIISSFILFPLIFYSITLGSDSLGYNYIDGYINDFRLYNRMLTQPEVNSIYTNAQNNNVFALNNDLDNSLISYYTFTTSTINLDSTKAVINNMLPNLSGILSDKSMIPNNNLISNMQILSKNTPNPPLTNGYILFSNPNNNFALETNIQVNKNFTINFWFYATNLGNLLTLASSDGYFINYQIPGQTPNILTRINNNISQNSSSNVANINVTTKFGVNTWNHFTVVYYTTIDYNQIPIINSKYYINGVLSNTGNPGIIPNGSIRINNLFGAINNINNFGNILQSFIGGITDFRIYKRALSSSEVVQLYNYNNYNNRINSPTLLPLINNLTSSLNASSPVIDYNPSLIMHYTFDSSSLIDNNQYVFNKGTQLYDGLIKNVNNLSKTFYKSYNTSLLCSFNNYLVNSSNILINNGITISLWFCINAFNSSGVNKIFSIIYNNSNELSLNYNASGSLFITNNNNIMNLNTSAGNFVLALNTWYFIYISSDLSKAPSIYICNSTLTYPLTNSSFVFPNAVYNSISLGAEALGNNYMNGYINDFRLYNQSFPLPTSLTDVTSTFYILYNYGLNTNSTCVDLDNDPNLISFYTFNSKMNSSINKDGIITVNNAIQSNTNNSIFGTISNQAMIPSVGSAIYNVGGKKYSSSNGIIAINSSNTFTLESNIKISPSFTICFWLYNLSNSNGNIITLFNGPGSFINIQVYTNKIYLTVNINNNPIQIYTSNTSVFKDSVFNHVTLVFNEFYDITIPTNNVICYVNGLIQPFNTTINVNLKSLTSTLNNTVGTNIYNNQLNPISGYILNNAGFSGYFTDLRLYQRALTSSEILVLYNKP